MSEPATPPSAPSTPPGGEVRRLERAPGERYGSAGPGSGSGGTADPGGSGGGSGPDPAPPGGVNAKVLIVAFLVAGGGALIFFVLGLMNIGVGLLAVAAFLGWVTAIALVWRGREAGVANGAGRIAVAAVLGGWAVAGGILLDWAYALVQGGVLGLLDYVGERYGPVALLSIAVAAAVAVARAR
jgi:hypothetical protein